MTYANQLNPLQRKLLKMLRAHAVPIHALIGDLKLPFARLSRWLGLSKFRSALAA